MNASANAPYKGCYPLFEGITSEYNILIAGSVGSGKSVFEEGLIYSIVNTMTPDEAELYLIDPKMVELDSWRTLPHCMGYADEIDHALDLLEEVTQRMTVRYKSMKARGLKTYPGSHIYVLIDELADLVLTDKKRTVTALQKILQLGRAAKIHLVCLSQTVSRYSIPSVLQVNFTCSVGLHCKGAIDSRMIIGENGCEKLPQYGQALVSRSGHIEKVDVPMIPADQIKTVKTYWRDMTDRG